MPDPIPTPTPPRADIPPPKPLEESSGAGNADRAADAAPGDRVDGEDLDERQDKLLDQAVEETFPASDPISPKRIT